MKFGCSIGNFLNSANLICRSTDISKCFRGSLRLRDNESRLYIEKILLLQKHHVLYEIRGKICICLFINSHGSFNIFLEEFLYKVIMKYLQFQNNF